MHRGFADDFLFAAKTTQDKVAGFERLYKCKDESGKWRKCKRNEKWSYAIPLEIIYLTPLSNWNPYNLQYKGVFNSNGGKTVTADKRSGQCLNNGEDTKAYDGINSKIFYMTPSGFFTGKLIPELS